MTKSAAHPITSANATTDRPNAREAPGVTRHLSVEHTYRAVAKFEVPWLVQRADTTVVVNGKPRFPGQSQDRQRRTPLSCPYGRRLLDRQPQVFDFFFRLLQRLFNRHEVEA